MARPSVKQNEDRALLGIGLMLIAYFVFSCIDTSVKWLGVLGLHALQLAFMRYAAHFFISLFIIGKDGFSRDSFWTDRPWTVIFRGSLIMFSTVLNFVAVRYLPLTLTATILFSAPLIVCALSWPMLGERVGLWRWLAIAVGFVGVVIAIRPFDESFHPAMILSIGAATCFALYSIFTRKLSGKVSTNTLQFYAGAVGFFALLPFAIVNWQNPQTLLDWSLMLGLGVLGWGGHQLLTNAHRFAPASTLMPYGYSFIVYLTIWSYLIFDHLPDQWTITGAAIIIAAGLLIWFRERKLAQFALVGAKRP